jgi:hypothetical protein
MKKIHFFIKKSRLKIWICPEKVLLLWCENNKKKNPPQNKVGLFILLV